jgi:hypothetical protein
LSRSLAGLTVKLMFSIQSCIAGVLSCSPPCGTGLPSTFSSPVPASAPIMHRDSS